MPTKSKSLRSVINILHYFSGLVGVVALRSVSAEQVCDRTASIDDGRDADAKTVDVYDAEGTCDVTVLFGVVTEPQVRGNQGHGCSYSPNSSHLYHNHSMPRPLRTGQLAPNQELALWMFVEFLKLAQLFMGRSPVPSHNQIKFG